MRRRRRYACNPGASAYLNGDADGNLVVSTFGGDEIVVGKKIRRLPVYPALTLTSDGLQPNTTYWIYVRWVGELEPVARTLPPVAQWDEVRQTGQSVNPEDHDETLVGMARTDHDGNWAWSPQDQLVGSWPNRWDLHAQAAIASDAPIADNGQFNVLGARVNLLTWGYSQIALVRLSVRATGSGVSVEPGILMDGTTLLAAFPKPIKLPAGDWFPISFALHLSTTFSQDPNPTDGYHFFEIAGKATGGSATVAAGSMLSVSLAG